MELLDGETLEKRLAARRRGCPAARGPRHRRPAARRARRRARQGNRPPRHQAREHLSHCATAGSEDARLRHRAPARADGARRTPRESGAAMGTPSYMPPEQARGRWERSTRAAISGRWARRCSRCSPAAACTRRETVNETLLLAHDASPRAPLASVLARSAAGRRGDRRPRARLRDERPLARRGVDARGRARGEGRARIGASSHGSNNGRTRGARRGALDAATDAARGHAARWNAQRAPASPNEHARPSGVDAGTRGARGWSRYNRRGDVLSALDRSRDRKRAGNRGSLLRALAALCAEPARGVLDAPATRHGLDTRRRRLRAARGRLRVVDCARPGPAHVSSEVARVRGVDRAPRTVDAIGQRCSALQLARPAALIRGQNPLTSTRPAPPGIGAAPTVVEPDEPRLRTR